MDWMAAMAFWSKLSPHRTRQFQIHLGTLPLWSVVPCRAFIFFWYWFVNEEAALADRIQAIRMGLGKTCHSYLWELVVSNQVQ